MKKAIITVILSIAFLPILNKVEASENLTLKQCLNYGIKNNISIIKANYDKQKSDYKVDEALSNGLPQIDGFVQVMDNVKKSVMILPGEMLGKPGSNITMEYGTQYASSAGVKINQLLYSQTYFLSLSVTKKLNKLSEVNLEKVKEDVIYDLSKMYSLASITNKQIQLIRNNMARLDSIIEITKALVDNGYAKSVDLDRVVVGKSSLQIQLDNTISLYKQQLDLIKYYINLPKEKDFVVVDTVKSFLSSSNNIFNEEYINNRKEIQLLELQKDLYNDNLKSIKYGYLPTLSFFSQFQYQNLREELEWFGIQWYANGYIGLNLSIPIFDGLNKNSKINQAKVDLNRAETELADTKKYFETNFQKVDRDYKTNTETLKRQKQNVDLAKSILNISKTKYQEGNMLMSDLLNDETNLSNSEQSYLNTQLQLLFSELDLLKSVGQLNIILNN